MNANVVYKNYPENNVFAACLHWPILYGDRNNIQLCTT